MLRLYNCPWSDHTSLHTQEHQSCVSPSLNVPCSNHSASAHARALPCVLRPFNCPWSDNIPSAPSRSPFCVLQPIDFHWFISTAIWHDLHMQEHGPLCSYCLIAPGPTTPLCIHRSTNPVFCTYLMSPALTIVLQHMQSTVPCAPTVSDCLISPGPTTYLLLLQGHCSVCSNQLVHLHCICICKIMVPFSPTVYLPLVQPHLFAYAGALILCFPLT
jgi:hypothetical protein